MPAKPFLDRKPDCVAPHSSALPLLRVRIEYAALNFRDFVTASGLFGAIPAGHVPGNEGAGIVLASEHPGFSAGDRVFVNGHGLGETLVGTMAGDVQVPAAAACLVPDEMTTLQAATAGVAALAAFAAQSVMGVGAQGLPVGISLAVTGAMGGTGRLAATYFARSGYRVTAITRDPAQADVLAELGVASVVGVPDAAALSEDTFGPETFDAAFDVTGGLVNWLCRHMRTDGTLALVGISAGYKVQINVLAVILRRLRLMGVKAGFGAEEKMEALRAVSKVLQPGDYERIASLAQPQDVARLLRGFGEGAGRGRIVVGLR